MTGLLAEMRQYNKPIIIVSNTPYEKFGVPGGFPTGIVCFAPNGRENLSVVADTLYRASVRLSTSCRMVLLPTPLGPLITINLPVLGIRSVLLRRPVWHSRPRL